MISVLATFVGIWPLGRVNRRPMLMSGQIGTTAALLLIGVFSLALPESLPTPLPKETITTVRVGVSGAGMIGQDHIRRLTEAVTGARVSAVTDMEQARATEVATCAGAGALPTGADLIAPPEVDAVLVTSWGPTHAEHVLNAVTAGKPVFREKPLASASEDCLRIVDAERAHGRRLVQVGFMRRFDVGYRQMKEVLASGSIGAPLIVHCAHRNPTVPESYTSAMAAQDTAVHDIDVVLWLLDERASPPTAPSSPWT
ncbi:Oxidoreductase family, NAD-binding Rossmann fold [Streptomyces mirabilis]|uniref:Oxidoreductase family, NAD-binding Rossmann fold n=1 Tax=Streptomyces mirabilis TaxID=68239 RepID=A0A1I2K7K7_9ACTN|nr:Oxidoreductase family, NAD-binding Rossmann fold [Streptomyces mirabilis]